MRNAISHNAFWHNSQVSNPFHYGSAVTGDRFTDRDTELRILRTCMLEGQNVILLSPRRYGKTSLLKRAVEEVAASGGRVGLANLIQCSNRREVAEELATAIARGPLGKFAAHLDELRRHLADLRPSFSVEAHGVKISLAPQVPNSDWTEEIKTALRTLQRLHTKEAPVSLVIDEFQRVAEINDGLPGVFKAMVDELEQVSLVFAGSRRHLMEELSSSPGAPLLGIGQRINLLPIPSDQMVPFLIDRARTGDKVLSEGSAALIYEFAHGVPNHVQQIAFWAFAEAEAEIKEKDVRRAIDTILSLSSVDFAEIFEKLSPAQQRLLRALANEPITDVYSRRFLDRIDVANASSTKRALERLDDMELIELSPAGWRVANPLFERWLSLDTVDDTMTKGEDGGTES